MQLKVLWATVLRRWYLALGALVCAIAATLLVVLSVGPTYKAEAAVLLLPPGTTVQRASSSGAQGNPFLSLGGVSQARDVVIRTLMASSTYEELCRQQGSPAYEEMRADLCKSSPGVTYEVTPDFTSSAPMILITVEAGSPAHAATALGAVADRVPVALAHLQAGLNLRPTALITSTPVVVDTNPEVVRKEQIRAGIVAGGGTAGLGLLVIALLDGLLASRRSSQIGSELEELAPVEAKPAEAVPVEAKPAEAVPVEAKPAEAVPVEAKPAEAVPVEAKPAEAVPVEAKPAEAVPVEAKPAEAVPVEAKPAEAVPVEAKPAEAVPVEAKPAEAVPNWSWPVPQWSGGQSQNDEFDHSFGNDGKPHRVTPLRGRRNPTSGWGDDMAAGQ